MFQDILETVVEYRQGPKKIKNKNYMFNFFFSIKLKKIKYYI